MYTLHELQNSSISLLQQHSKEIGISQTSIYRKQIIETITSSPYYTLYNEICENILSTIDCSLTKEQQNIFSKLFLFLEKRVSYEEVYKEVEKVYIPDIAKLIVEKLSFEDIDYNKQKITVLEGGAGTGKTYVISHIIASLSMLHNTLFSYSDENNIDFPLQYIQVLAPTNKAIKVIREKIYDICNSKKIYKNCIMFSTISKFLQQNIEYTKDGDMVYKTSSYISRESLDTIRYIIIDEASMISRNNWNDLQTQVFRKCKNVRILLLGDKCQLSPVKEPTSIIFSLRYPKIHISSILRTKSKDMISVYNTFREAFSNHSLKIPNNTICKKSISFIQTIKSQFNIDTDIILSYSNKSVNEYNKLVRNTLFNNPKEEFVVGEKILFSTSVKCANIHGSFTDAKYHYYANDGGTVRGIEEIVFPISTLYTIDTFPIQHIFPNTKFTLYKLQIEFQKDEISHIYYVKKEHYTIFESYFQEVYENIKDFIYTRKITRKQVAELWDLYYTIKNTLHAPITYSYALTIHKSQGSTFSKVFIDFENICNSNTNKEDLYKSFYTAVTRASDIIYYKKYNNNDYTYRDTQKYPFLHNYTIIPNHKVCLTIQNGQEIVYTRNDFYKDTRKLVRGVVKKEKNDIFVSNSSYTWKFVVKDDMIVYTK